MSILSVFILLFLRVGLFLTIVGGGLSHRDRLLLSLLFALCLGSYSTSCPPFEVWHVYLLSTAMMALPLLLLTKGIQCSASILEMARGSVTPSTFSAARSESISLLTLVSERLVWVVIASSEEGLRYFYKFQTFKVYGDEDLKFLLLPMIQAALPLVVVVLPCVVIVAVAELGQGVFMRLTGLSFDTAILRQALIASSLFFLPFDFLKVCRNYLSMYVV